MWSVHIPEWSATSRRQLQPTQRCIFDDRHVRVLKSRSNYSKPAQQRATPLPFAWLLSELHPGSLAPGKRITRFDQAANWSASPSEEDISPFPLSNDAKCYTVDDVTTLFAPLLRRHKRCVSFFDAFLKTRHIAPWVLQTVDTTETWHTELKRANRAVIQLDVWNQQPYVQFALRIII